MFWKKKQSAATPVSQGIPAGDSTGVTPAVKTEAPPEPKAEKLPKPKIMPEFVGKYIAQEYKLPSNIVNIFKIVVRPSSSEKRVFDCRVFGESEAEASGVTVKSYTSLDEHPDLILYEGWFDEHSKRVELKERKRPSYDVPLLTEGEILQKIEALSQSASTVFFYQARGPAAGGPLGRGAAIVELNPNYPGKKMKKYIVYTANVVGMEPVDSRLKLFDSDKPGEVAKWIKDAHHERRY